MVWKMKGAVMSFLFSLLLENELWWGSVQFLFMFVSFNFDIFKLCSIFNIEFMFLKVELGNIQLSQDMNMCFIELL